LKKGFLTETEALLHGDLHTGSVFADNHETKVIDPEFAFYGPAGFDIGQVFANLLFQVIVNEDKRDLFINHIERVWNVFEEQYAFLWNTENKVAAAKTSTFLNYQLNKFFEDSLGFAGCELIRRTIGLSHVADLDGIENEQTRIAAKQKTLEAIGRISSEGDSMMQIENKGSVISEIAANNAENEVELSIKNTPQNDIEWERGYCSVEWTPHQLEFNWDIPPRPRIITHPHSVKIHMKKLPYVNISFNPEQHQNTKAKGKKIDKKI
jgi:hypothetical protein